VPKGRPWSVEEERQLKTLREEGKTVAEIALRMKQTPDAIKQKLRRLGLKVVTLEKSGGTTTSGELIIPEELCSVEDALKILAGAMEVLKTPGLSKTEILRLRSLVQVADKYQTRIAEYMDYRGLEVEMLEWREKYAELAKRANDRPVTPGIASRSRTVRLGGNRRPASFYRTSGNQAKGDQVPEVKN
jgi:hypothetical protein